jgi:hypothetical protein
VTRLSELIRGAMDGTMSARAVARTARERGHTLNHDTVARYVRGDHGVPDEATLRALSDVLDLPMARLRAAADLPSESTDEYVPPPEASRMSRRQRRAVDELIRSMVEPTRSAVPAKSDAARPTRRAARHGRAEPPVD